MCNPAHAWESAAAALRAAAERDLHRAQIGMQSHAMRTPPSGDLAQAFARFLESAEVEGHRLRLREWLDFAEAWRIEQALRRTRGNRSAAARELGIGRRTLYAKMHKLGL